MSITKKNDRNFKIYDNNEEKENFHMFVKFVFKFVVDTPVLDKVINQSPRPRDYMTGHLSILLRNRSNLFLSLQNFELITLKI